MYSVYFDSGTSNTRAYLLKDRDIICTEKANIGSKDSSISKSNEILLKGLKGLYDKLLLNKRIMDKNVKDIYASGMITSPYGIKEVPHISTPISLNKMFQGIYTYYESRFFKREIRLIRGAKTVSDNFIANTCNIEEVNNTRGEEIEVFGVLSALNYKWRRRNIAIILPGSHTNIGYVRNEELQDILSTFSGELFHAISTSTILSGSIISNNNVIDKEMVLLGVKNIKKYGFNRALYIGHAMKIFNASDSSQRKWYLEGVINAGVIDAFIHKLEDGWDDVQGVVIAGGGNAAEVYRLILSERKPHLETAVLKNDGNKNYAVKGFVSMLSSGGTVCKKKC